MPKKHYLTLAAACLLGALGLSSTGLAGTETAATAGKESKAVVTPPAPNYISGDFGVTFVSEYISRGLILQTKGVIAEPYTDLYFKFYEGDGFITSMTAQLSLWWDIGSNHAAAAPGVNAPDWLEFDWDPGVSIVFAKSFTLTTSYFEFDSPNSAAGYPARSINANLAYDDSAFMGPFAMHPHFTVLYELGAPGLAGLGPHGWYYELGVAPGYTFLKSSKYPVTFTLPVTVGLGDSRFYHDNKFGYVSVGATLAVPLAFVPAGYGSWTLTAGYTYYHDDDALTEPQFRGADTNGKADQHVFSGAIGCTF